jgi:hypothetical protein
VTETRSALERINAGDVGGKSGVKTDAVSAKIGRTIERRCAGGTDVIDTEIGDALGVTGAGIVEEGKGLGRRSGGEGILG